MIEPDYSAKQVIVMRTDLNMRKGKMVAQGAHASIAFLTRRLVGAGTLTLAALGPAEQAWLVGRFTKICVGVRSEEELLAIDRAALEAGLTSSLILDAGFTEFAGVPTHTCCAVGPGWNGDVDAITGGLMLL